jgi:hypothetical protein
MRFSRLWTRPSIPRLGNWSAVGYVAVAGRPSKGVGLSYMITTGSFLLVKRGVRVAAQAVVPRIASYRAIIDVATTHKSMKVKTQGHQRSEEAWSFQKSVSESKRRVMRRGRWPYHYGTS